MLNIEEKSRLREDAAQIFNSQQLKTLTVLHGKKKWQQLVNFSGKKKHKSAVNAHC